MSESPTPEASNWRDRLKRWPQWAWRYKVYPIVLVAVLVLLPLLRHDASHYTIRGVDVSRYQREIDWALLSEQDRLHFIFIKATEGRSYVDPTFKDRWPAARKAGLLRGAYHFYKPTQSAVWQARHFVQTVPLTAGDLPPVLDVEDLDRVPEAQVVREVGRWLELVEEHYGIRPIIYTSLHWYESYLGQAFPDHLFWVARYHRQQPDVKWTFWQYSSRTYVDGIKGRVDGNVFAGTRWQLEGLCL